jgi:ferredoxin
MTDKEKTPVKMKDVLAKAEEKKCPVQQSLVFIEEFLSEPMCGRCFPCSMGSYEARIRIRKLVDGSGSDEDISAIREIAGTMAVASMCKKGKDTAKFLLENIDSDDFKNHLSGICENRECVEYIKYVIIPEKCTMCGVCQDVCRDNAILGEKIKPFMSGYAPFEIVQKRCTKCGECIKVCPEEAIECVSISVEKEEVKA